MFECVGCRADGAEGVPGEVAIVDRDEVELQLSLEERRDLLE
jgi:hypothetical protein